MNYPIKVAALIILILVNLVIYSRLLESFGILSFNLTTAWEFEFINPKLSLIVNRHLANQPGEYAILIERLGEKEDKFSLNSQRPFPAGSLYKLFLLAATFQEIENGQLSKDQKINGSITHLKEVLGFADFGYPSTNSGSGQVQDDQISYQVDEILARIATISDNYAAIMLAEKIGWDKIQNQAKKLGANSTTIKSPISTTAADIGLFFKKLYAGEVVSKQSSDQIINLLSKSKLSSRIPGQLPKDTKIAHKTAELPRIRHDAGIVYLDPSTSSGPYIIVLMSKDLKFEDDGVETLAKISKEVYDYFKSKEK